MYSLIRRILFLLPPENAHHFTMTLLKVILKTPFLCQFFKAKSSPDQSVKLPHTKLIFKNRLGLAAGFDKNAEYLDVLSQLGFGFIEIGTVTPEPQNGNPKPRLFRLHKDQALINRMGFNNEGVNAIAERLKYRPSDIIIGGNIGKNKSTPQEKAVDDYLICLKKLYPFVDYFVINVSSPNTPGLRELQNKDELLKLLEAINKERKQQKTHKPILLKIAPDLTDTQLDDIVNIVLSSGIEGIIATNTTIERSGLKTDQATLDKIGNGGLSGAPLSERSLDVLKKIRKIAGDRLLLISSGGIMNENDAKERLDAGADLVQIYTGFVYNGVGLIRRVLVPTPPSPI